MTLKISKAILFALFFILVFGLFSVEIKDPDFWWHLKTGEYIYQHGALPETDPFAYTSLSKDPIAPQSKRIHFILTQYWLAQVIFYWIYHLLGLQGIIYLRAGLLTVLMLLIYKGLRREGAGLYLSLLFLAPMGVIFRAFTGERPQLFSFLFAFLLIFLLEGFRRAAVGDLPPIDNDENKTASPNPSNCHSEFISESGIFNTFEPRKILKRVQDDNCQTARRSREDGLKFPAIGYLFPVPFMMLLWANLHGGFILGMVIIAGYLCTESLKRISGRLGRALPPNRLKLLIGTGMLSILAPLINPNGYNVLPFLLEFEKGPYKGMIIESMSPVFIFRSGFHDPYLLMYFFLLSLCLLIFLLNIRKLDLTDAIITLGLAVVSLSSSRYIPFFAPAATLMIVRYGSPMLDRLRVMGSLKKLREKADWTLPVVLAIALVIVINNSNLFKHGIRANKYPEGAAKFLKENKISGNMFNPYVWGGYLMWTLYPDYKVFVDGRALIGEVFFQEVKIMEAYPENIAGLPEWKALLNAYNVSSIITYSVGNFTGRLVPLIPALLSDPEWHLVYFDNVSLIFVRDSAQNAGILSRFDLPKEWLWNEVAVEAALKAQDYRNNVNYLITQGDALLQKRSFADAKAAYLKALQIDPKNGRVAKRLEFIRAYGY